MQGSPRELVERAQRGDESAFELLVGQHQRAALAVAYAVVGDSSTAGDVTQEGLLRAWQKLDTLDDPERFGAWLARIVRNLAHDWLRRKPHEVQQNGAYESGAPHMRLVVDPSNEIDRSETRRTINAALAELDETTRTAVALRYYDGMSSKEIGEVLDLSPAAVDMRLSRGRAELKKKLASLAPQSVRECG